MLALAIIIILMIWVIIEINRNITLTNHNKQLYYDLMLSQEKLEKCHGTITAENNINLKM